MCSSLAEYLDDTQIDFVEKAYRVGAQAHKGQRRKSGENYINHPLAVACILADLHLDCATISAAILHDTVEDTALTVAELTEEFGPEVAALVSGVSKVSKAKFGSKSDYEAENIRRLFMAMSKDIRVVLIKLADRIHNLESVDVHSLEKRRRIIRETKDIYIPIANLLGMYNWRERMEDLCFRAMYPTRYKTIGKAVRKGIGGRVDDIIKRHTRKINLELKKNRVEAEVSGRFKNIASIHDKMKRKGNSLSAVQDLFAFRVIVSDIDSCYRTLGVIHRRYKPVSGGFSDYIAIPKSNGYQSLHTVVHGEFGRSIEVQIRTLEMHRIAESGVASHLSYKASTSSRNASVPGLQSLNDLIRDIDESESLSEYLNNMRMDLFFDYVHVFMPNGEIKRLKKGATVIDFAYAVHTDVGDGIKSAVINGQRVPLHTVLNNGDSVKINSGRTKNPDPNWLNFVVTSRARMAIRKVLKKKSEKEKVRLGRNLIKKALKSYGIKSSSISSDVKDRLLEKLNLGEWSEMLNKIGSGELNATITVGQLFRELSPDSEPSSPNSVSVSLAGTEGTIVKYPKCCSPLPPEPIVGHLVPGRGFVIHHAMCSNVRASKYPPEHWVKFDWANQPKSVFRASIRIDSEDRKGVLAAVTTRISSAEANILDCRLHTTQNGNEATLLFDIQVSDTDHLKRVMRNIQRDSRVVRVSRLKDIGQIRDLHH